MKWALSDTFKKNDIKTALTFIIDVKCSLYGSEQFTLVLQNPQLLQDLDGNKFQEKIFKTKSFLFFYMTESELEAVAGSGSAFSYSSLLALFIVVIAVLFQYSINFKINRSIAVNTFWEFVSMIQILSFITVINGNLPQNLVIFLNNYVPVTSIVLPFNLIFPNYLNPLQLFNVFLGYPYNNQFYNAGYQSVNFLYNWASQILTWILLFLAYVCLIFLCKILPDKR